jgi:hypothetical protein
MLTNFQPPQAKPQAGVMQPYGQPVNRASIMEGLTKNSAVKPDAGSVTGNGAASDFAKALLMSNQADAGLEADKRNAEIGTQRQAQKQQLFDAWNKTNIARYQNQSGQQSKQLSLAQELLGNQIGMQERWKTGLIGMMR